MLRSHDVAEQRGNEIRSEVQSLRKGRGRKYSKALRERVLSWMKCALDDGWREVECMQARHSAPAATEVARGGAVPRGDGRAAALIPRPSESTALVPADLDAASLTQRATRPVLDARKSLES